VNFRFCNEKYDGVVWSRWVGAGTTEAPPKPTVPGGAMTVVGCASWGLWEFVYATALAAALYLAGGAAYNTSPSPIYTKCATILRVFWQPSPAQAVLMLRRLWPRASAPWAVGHGARSWTRMMRPTSLGCAPVQLYRVGSALEAVLAGSIRDVRAARSGAASGQAAGRIRGVTPAALVALRLQALCVAHAE
jgi:hypothetical protein